MEWCLEWFKALAWSSLYRAKAETKLVYLEERPVRKERILVKKKKKIVSLAGFGFQPNKEIQ